MQEDRKYTVSSKGQYFIVEIYENCDRIDVWGRGSAGRASRSQREGRGFESLRLHCKRF